VRLITHKFPQIHSPLTTFLYPTQYLSDELFSTLPLPLRQLTYTGKDSTPSPESLTPLYPLQTLPHAFTDSLISYGVISDEDDAGKIALAAIEEYAEEAGKPPPIWKDTKKDVEECEICERRVGLAYHHLIPVCYYPGQERGGERESGVHMF